MTISPEQKAIVDTLMECAFEDYTEVVIESYYYLAKAIKDSSTKELDPLVDKLSTLNVKLLYLSSFVRNYSDLKVIAFSDVESGLSVLSDNIETIQAMLEITKILRKEIEKKCEPPSLNKLVF